MVDVPSISRHVMPRTRLGWMRFVLPAGDLCALGMTGLGIQLIASPTVELPPATIANLLLLAALIVLYGHATLIGGAGNEPLLRRRFVCGPAAMVGISVLASSCLESAIQTIVAGHTKTAFMPELVLIWACVAAATVGILRLLSWHPLVLVCSAKSPQTRIAIVGAGSIGTQLVQLINRHFPDQLQITGIYDERATRVPKVIEGIPVVGNMSALSDAVRHEEVDKILVALPLSAEERLLSLLQKLKTFPIDVALIPDGIGLRLIGNVSSESLDRFLLHILHRPLSNEDQALKRLFDVVISASLLLLLSPLMTVIGLVVAATSSGPILFRQPRAGLNDDIINVFKFRTMYVEQSDLLARQQTRRNDPRVTPIGRFLRKTSIDELPQLLNVLRGEMSLVGPRPHATGMQVGGRLCHDILREYAQRHRVKPGITGWAQVCGFRGAVEDPAVLMERIERDIYYIDNWSLWFDIKILLMTMPEIIRSRNAF